GKPTFPLPLTGWETQNAVIVSKLASHYLHGDCDLDVVSRDVLRDRALNNKGSFKSRVSCPLSPHAGIELRDHKIERRKIPVVRDSGKYKHHAAIALSLGSSILTPI